MELLIISIAVYLLIVILYTDLTISSMRVIYEDRVFDYKSRMFNNADARKMAMSIFKDFYTIFKILLKTLVPIVNIWFYIYSLLEFSFDKEMFKRSSNKDTALITIIKRKKSITSLVYRDILID